MRPRALLALLVLPLLALACGGDGDDGADGAAGGRTTSTVADATTTTDGRWPTCEHGEGVYAVAHPPDWAVNDGSVVAACSLFDPTSVDVEPGTEIPAGLAIVLRVEPVAAGVMTADGPSADVTDERTATVAGRSATRQQTVATGDALLPEGVRTTRWVVPLGPQRSLVARTNDVGPLDYERKQAVLDRMVRSLRLLEEEAGDGEQGAQPVGEPGTDTVESAAFPSPSGPTAYLQDVRLAARPGFDRLVFEFDENVPAYRVGYVEPPVREAGSGREVEIEGDAFLRVEMTPASGVDLQGQRPRETYAGPDRLRLDGGAAVVEVVETGDFEAHLSWTIGLTTRVPFAVTTLTGPPRLVVDLVPR